MARATIVEEGMNSVEDQEQLVNFDAEAQRVESEPEPEPQEDELPEKYRGKSHRELAEMHQNAEKMIGKHSSEVGELRRVVDDFIRSQATTTPQASEDDDDVDFFVDPQEAIKRAIEKHPSVQQANQYSQQAKLSAAQAELQRKHPDIGNIISDEAFGEWIKASKVRLRLYQEAEQNYDFDAADELVSTWKELKGRTTQAVDAEAKARKATAKQAATGSARASSEPMARKKYRRSDIINLMKNDPKRYEQLQPEIMQAYAEGRVV